ncbi:hypothetical protein KIPB_007645, partial [Kipferlia bialata]|eukprot:g7645.t1
MSVVPVGVDPPPGDQISVVAVDMDAHTPLGWPGMAMVDQHSALIIGRNTRENVDNCVIVSLGPGCELRSEVVPSPIDDDIYAITATRVGGSVLIFGGFNDDTDDPTPCNNTLWEFCRGCHQWRKVPHPEGADWPQERCNHVAVEMDGQLLIVGGFDNNLFSLCDTWLFDTHTENWTRFPDPPIDVVGCAAQ